MECKRRFNQAHAERNDGQETINLIKLIYFDYNVSFQLYTDEVRGCIVEESTPRNKLSRETFKFMKIQKEMLMKINKEELRIKNVISLVSNDTAESQTR